jgi:rhomboid protease GluP
MVERLPDGSQVFRASWRGGTTWLAGTCLVLALLMTTWATASDDAPMALWGFAVFFGALGLVLFKPLVSRLPVVQVGPQGVSGQLLRGHTVPWSDITDVGLQVVQGREVITLTLRAGSPLLAPTKPLIGGGLVRGLSLDPLRRDDRARATLAVMQAFRRHAGAQAQLAQQAAWQETLDHEAFDQRLRETTPSLWALYAVMALNVGVWLANLTDGLDPMQPATADLFRWGASSATAVVRDGELWRLLTATVLHGGLLHLALNMYALWIGGTQVARWFGNGQFLLIYWGSALAGASLSLHFAAQQAVSVGASGAVFGVLGALLAGVLQHRERIPKAVLTQLLTSQGLFVLFSLGQGFTRDGIDNAAHVGGLLAGATMGWLLVERVDPQAAPAVRRRGQGMSVAVVALAVSGLLWAAQPGVDHRQLFAEQGVLRQVLPAYQSAEQALLADIQAHRTGDMTRAQLVDTLRRIHMPAYQDLGEQLARASDTVSSDRLASLSVLQSGWLEIMAMEVNGVTDTVRAEARAGELLQAMQLARERLQARP